jgi:hypothetical protein
VGEMTTQPTAAESTRRLWGWLALLPVVASGTVRLPLATDARAAVQPTARALAETYLLSDWSWEDDDAVLAHIEGAVAGVVSPWRFVELQAWATLLDLGNPSSDAWLLSRALRRLTAAEGTPPLDPRLMERLASMWALSQDRTERDAWDEHLERVCTHLDLEAIAESLRMIVAHVAFRAFVRSLNEPEWNTLRDQLLASAEPLVESTMALLLHELRAADRPLA